jgi:segregation and condensation protein A
VITFQPGARPEHAAHVRLEAFDGPLALLLALIEERQLDVLTVPLGDLAAGYLEAVSSLGDDRLPHISAFVGLASQLILIKSRALLPRPPDVPAAVTEDGLDPEEELRERLILYRRYRDAGARLAERMAAGLALFHREPSAAAAAGSAGARPADLPPLDPGSLAEALSRSISLVVPPPPPPEIVPRTVTLEERAAIIRRALRRSSQVVLQDLLRGITDRVVLAVTFMAMLELVKGGELTVEQEEPFGPIVCRRPAPAEHGDVATASGDAA